MGPRFTKKRTQATQESGKKDEGDEMGDRENDDMFDLLSMLIDFHFSEIHLFIDDRGEHSCHLFQNIEMIFCTM